jgi:hypothetical protein
MDSHRRVEIAVGGSHDGRSGALKSRLCLCLEVSDMLIGAASGPHRNEPATAFYHLSSNSG